MKIHNPEEALVSEVIIEEEKSHFNHLPDEILLHIFNKLIDLKTLCFCSLVSRRFASIIPHVHCICFTVPHQKPNSTFTNNPNPVDNIPQKLFRFLINGVVAKPFKLLRQFVSRKPIPRSISSFYGDSFISANSFLSKFQEIRFLEIELPSSCNENDDGFDGNLLFKWSAKFGSKIDTFIFLSLTSIHQKQQQSSCNNGQEETEVSRKAAIHLAFQCLKDAIVRHRILLFFIEQHPLLERVAITDSKKQGMLCLSNEKLVELRGWIGFNAGTMGLELKRIEVPVSARQWCVPMLELPVSGLVIEGATLVLMGMGSGGDGGSDHFDDGTVLPGSLEVGEEAFGEAVMEIMLSDRSKMKTLL